MKRTLLLHMNILLSTKNRGLCFLDLPQKKMSFVDTIKLMKMETATAILTFVKQAIATDARIALICFIISTIMSKQVNFILLMMKMAQKIG